MVEEEQNINQKGEWWLPDKADRKIVGELTIDSNNHIFIKTEEPLFKKAQYRLGDFEKFDIILGKTYNNELITLVNCKSGISIPFGGISYSELAFIGVHFTKKSDILLSEINAQYSNLEQWAFIFGFNNNPDSAFFKGGPQEQGEMIIKYKNPDSILLTKFDDFVILLKFGANSQIQWSKIDINQYDYISIKSSKLQPFIKFENIFRQMQNFFTLAVNQPVYITKLDGLINKKQAEEAQLLVSEHLKRYDEIDIKIYSRLINKKYNDVHFPQMLFNFSNIIGKQDSIITKWFERANKFESIYELYFSTIFNPYMYPQQRFINIVQALESYHRIVMNHPKMHPSEFKALKNTILEKVPEYRDWLDERLANSNQISLLTRLIELFQKYEGFLNNDSINEELLIAVKDTRNYLIHRETKPNNLLEGENLVKATIKLKLLLEICLLEEIGFKIEDIVLMFKNHRGDYTFFFKTNI